MPRACYAPPPFDQRLLVATIIDQYDIRDNKKARELIQELVWSYMTWWMLMLTFPKREILCTAPIWEVRRTHANLNKLRFIDECLQYLGRIPQRTEVMGANGVKDEHHRVLTTAESLQELFDNPGMAWIPIQERAKAIKAEPVVSLW